MPRQPAPVPDGMNKAEGIQAVQMTADGSLTHAEGVSEGPLRCARIRLEQLNNSALASGHKEERFGAASLRDEEVPSPIDHSGGDQSVLFEFAKVERKCPVGNLQNLEELCMLDAGVLLNLMEDALSDGLVRAVLLPTTLKADGRDHRVPGPMAERRMKDDEIRTMRDWRALGVVTLPC